MDDPFFREQTDYSHLSYQNNIILKRGKNVKMFVSTDNVAVV